MAKRISDRPCAPPWVTNLFLRIAIKLKNYEKVKLITWHLPKQLQPDRLNFLLFWRRCYEKNSAFI